ncbi:MAG: tetratricopeptide repeat protein [Suipraeoptans sp.]
MKIKKVLTGLFSIILVALLALLAYIIIEGINPTEKGLELLKEGKYTSAITKFEQAIDKDINIADAYRGIGIAKFEQEDYSGAKDAFTTALSKGAEESAAIYNFLALIAQKENDVDAAIANYTKGLSIEGASDDLKKEMLANLAVSYENIRDYENARETLRLYLELVPDDTSAKKELDFLETR